MNLPKVSINIDLKDGLCFGCGQNNPWGLKLNFKWDGKTARSEFIPSKFHQGWPGIVHGGIITSIIDESMSYLTHRFQGIACLTAKLQIRFKRPAMIGEPLVVIASTIRNTRKLLETKARILSKKDGSLVAEGTAVQLIVDRTHPENAQGNV